MESKGVTPLFQGGQGRSAADVERAGCFAGFLWVIFAIGVLLVALGV